MYQKCVLSMSNTFSFQSADSWLSTFSISTAVLKSNFWYLDTFIIRSLILIWIIFANPVIIFWFNSKSVDGRKFLWHFSLSSKNRVMQKSSKINRVKGKSNDSSNVLIWLQFLWQDLLYQLHQMLFLILSALFFVYKVDFCVTVNGGMNHFTVTGCHIQFETVLGE